MKAQSTDRCASFGSQLRQLPKLIRAINSLSQANHLSVFGGCFSTSPILCADRTIESSPSRRITGKCAADVATSSACPQNDFLGWHVPSQLAPVL